MKRRTLLAAAKVMVLSAVISASPASSAPLPPAPMPSELEVPVDGYDMRPPFQLWRNWVESKKGTAIQALLAEPEQLQGLEHFGLLVSYTRSGYIHMSSGEIRAYCQRAPNQRFTPISDTCVYVFRRANVPFTAGNYGKANPLSDWTFANFDTQALARHFRVIGLPTEPNWWATDREKMFAALPSPRAIITENAKVLRLDSTECPQMHKAIRALEGQQLDTSIDFVAVGEDEKLRAPDNPQARTDYKIHLRADGSNYTVEGWSGPAAQMARPILDAVDTCERARKVEATPEAVGQF